MSIIGRVILRHDPLVVRAKISNPARTISCRSRVQFLYPPEFPNETPPARTHLRRRDDHPPYSPPSPERPNIVVFLADDLSVIRLHSPTAARSSTTLNMEKLADAGMKFERAICRLPCCAPGRAAHAHGPLPDAQRRDVQPPKGPQGTREMARVLPETRLRSRRDRQGLALRGRENLRLRLRRFLQLPSGHLR